VSFINGASNRLSLVFPQPRYATIVYFDGVVFDTSERNGSAIMTTERYLRIRGSEGQSDKEEEREGGSGTEKGPPPPRGL